MGQRFVQRTIFLYQMGTLNQMQFATQKNKELSEMIANINEDGEVVWVELSANAANSEERMASGEDVLMLEARG